MKLFFCVALVLCLMLSGCSYDAGSLLALPRTEENERILANQIFPLITNQIEYALPSSGDMTVPALDIDLTGDGTLETVSCLLKKRWRRLAALRRSLRISGGEPAACD